MRLSRFLAVPLFLSIAVAARADDPKTNDLSVKAVYKVGEVQTSTSHDETLTDVKVMTAEGVVAFSLNEKEIVEFAATHKVLEIDAEGHVSKELYHFSMWKYSKGEDATSELTGAHVTVTGRGPARAWTIMTPDLTPSKHAKAWLDKHYGPDEKVEFGEVIKPSKQVAIGESWDVDVSKLAGAMGKEMALDAAKSTAKATLDKVDGDVATIGIVLKLQVTSMSGGGEGQTMKVLEGGVLEMSGDGRSPLLSAARGKGGTMTIKLEAKTDAQQNMTTTLSISGSQQSSTKAGGEMPEVPAAKEAPAVK